MAAEERAVHTAGPWTLGATSSTARDHAIIAGSMVIARVNGFGYPVGEGWSPESAANARLISAAPELLVELRQSLRIVEAQVELATAMQGIALRAWAERLRAIITKVEG